MTQNPAPPKPPQTMGGKTTEPAKPSSTVALIQSSVSSPDRLKPADLSAKPADAHKTEATKMDIAIEIFKRMRKIKGVTRKEILDQFIAEAKLSKAGASTYYQLIRQRLKD